MAAPLFTRKSNLLTAVRVVILLVLAFVSLERIEARALFASFQFTSDSSNASPEHELMSPLELSGDDDSQDDVDDFLLPEMHSSVQGNCSTSREKSRRLRSMLIPAQCDRPPIL